jgi:hypothetical protein
MDLALKLSNKKAEITEHFILKVLKENNIKKIPNKFVKINEQEDSIWVTYKNKRLDGTLVFEFNNKTFQINAKIIYQNK